MGGGPPEQIDRELGTTANRQAALPDCLPEVTEVRMAMDHKTFRVISVTPVQHFTLRIRFDDDTEQTIDFSPILEGEVYGPLRDEKMFQQVEIDPEIHTVVWPNGADFDPETLHDWPQYATRMRAMAKQWAAARVGT